MTTIETIRAEIERRMKDEAARCNLGGIWVLDSLLSFVDALEVQPDTNCNGLDDMPDKMIYVKIDNMGDVYRLDADSLANRGEEYIRKGLLLDWVKLVLGKVSMNPFDCSEA